MGKVVLMLARMSGESGIRVPPELAMLGKTLLNLDQVGRSLDPGFDPNASIRRNAADLTRRRLRQSLSPANILSGLMEVKEFAERLPGRINRILDTVASNGLEVKVDAIDEKALIEGYRRSPTASRWGHPGALIVSAAMLMPWRRASHPRLSRLPSFLRPRPGRRGAHAQHPAPDPGREKAAREKELDGAAISGTLPLRR